MLRWSVSRFSAANIWYGHGTDNPWDEAVQLEIAIEKTYWKGVAYPVREIQVGNDIFRVSVKSLCDELVNDMHNGIYEAMEASEEIDW